jgi:hypothetical protein
VIILGSSTHGKSSFWVKGIGKNGIATTMPQKAYKICFTLLFHKDFI